MRGNPYTFGDDAPRAFPSLLSRRQAKLFTKGSGRLELAEEIIRQPITVARHRQPHLALAHRAAASSTRRATSAWSATSRRNPELLDYLATKFVADGMSWKKLHKEILMSRTYQLSAAPVAANAGEGCRQPLLLARQPRRALEAEGIWDALLQAAGALDLERDRRAVRRPDREDDAPRGLRQGEPDVSERLPGRRSTCRRRRSRPRSATRPTCRSSGCSS